MWEMIALWFGLQVVSYFLFRPKGQEQAQVTPGELETTTVDASSPVPVLFGTRLISTANCVWYGDVATTAIRNCSKGGKK
jgi:hypothetical protein